MNGFTQGVIPGCVLVTNARPRNFECDGRSVFDLTSFTKVATVDVGQQASGITFWKMQK